MKMVGKSKARTLVSPPSDLSLTHDEFVDWLWTNWPYDSKEAYVGLSRFWGMSVGDPFNYCAWMHDGYYTFKHVHGRSRKFGDLRFDDCMRKVVERGRGSRVRRVFYKAIVRSPIGLLAWMT